MPDNEPTPDAKRERSPPNGQARITATANIVHKRTKTLQYIARRAAPMSEPDTDKRGRSPLAIAVTGAIGVPLLPVLYVLSIGPATWLFLNGYIPGMFPIMWPFYAPLRYFRANGIFCAFIDWYIALWG